MADEVRDVDFDVVAHDKSSEAIQSMANELDRLDKKAKGNQRSFKDLEDESGKLSKKLDATRAAAALLGREMQRTGDTTLLKDFEKLNREAGRLQRAVKAIDFEPDTDKTKGVFGGLVDAAKRAGLLAADATVTGIRTGLQAVPPEVAAGIAALAVPVLVGTVNAALLAGIGGSGLAAGVALAVRDPAVQAAFGGLGDSALLGLDKAVEPFKLELIEIAGDWEAAFDEALPGIQRSIAQLAPELRPIAAGITGMLRNLGPGLSNATAASIPLLRQLANLLPAIGSGIGYLFDSLAEGGKGAELVFRMLILSVHSLILTVGFFIRAVAPAANAVAWLAEKVGVFRSTGDDTRQSTGDLSDELDRLGLTAGSAASSYEDLAQSLGNTANAARALQENFDRLFSETMNLDQANLAVKAGLTDLTQTLRENKRTLDDNTTAGQENSKAILEQINRLNAKREAEIAAGNGTKEATERANAAYAGNLAQLRSLLLTLGFTTSEVDRLIGKYDQLAKPRSTTFTTVFRTEGTAPPGYGDAKTGHSRTGSQDFSGFDDGWSAARFANAESMRIRSVEDSAPKPYEPPLEVHSEHTILVSLDGKPFEAQAISVVNRAERRQAWRAKTGRRP